MSWPLVKLGEVAPSKALKKPAVLDDDKVWQLNLDMVESGSGRVLNKIKAPLSEAGSSTHWFDSRHVLYSKLRPYLNKVVLPDEQGLATTELVPMLPDPERLDRGFLVHYLRSKQFVSWISDQVAGAKMPRVSMTVLWDHEIPLPPLEEQKRIAAILDKADAIRQKRKQAIDLADEFLRSVFLDMFGDPVTNPKGWEVKEIDQVCTEIVDCVNRTAPTVDYETPYKMIRTTNIRNHKIDLSSVRYVEKEVYEKWVRRLKPEVGDVIFTREAPAGEAGIINFNDSVFLGQRTMHFRPESEKITSTFLLYELMAPGVQQQIARLSAGSTVTHLSVPECKKFKIRTPSLENQQRFTDIVDKVERSKNSLLASLEQSIELFHSLSQKAFSGQL
ncbi:restriction endonuclease subunit S [Vibrio metschnikovii]|uniref:restriction endonuclease subunit S n=1 Tax=Vibrio metschnikovii TaxID=28172 RepID=UPI002878E085|nr:restriction endonuclease subunit S [Vibrio metschnikovii]EKO3599423.1 restriction endonuclease subunit S [Vibrio metschnikovii]ELF5342371.1 restriction endonuclease subunit S [Vibrio metschnikovii]